MIKRWSAAGLALLALFALSGCGKKELQAQDLAQLFTQPMQNVTMEAKVNHVTFQRVKAENGTLYQWFSSSKGQTEVYQLRENDRDYRYEKNTSGHWIKKDVTETAETPPGLILFTKEPLSGSDFQQLDDVTFQLSSQKSWLFYQETFQPSFPNIAANENNVTVTAKTKKGRLCDLEIQVASGNSPFLIEVAFSDWDHTKIVLPGLASEQSASTLEAVAQALTQPVQNVTITAFLNQEPFQTYYISDGRVQSITHKTDKRTETISCEEDGKPVLYTKKADGSWKKETRRQADSSFTLLPKNTLMASDIQAVGFNQYMLIKPEARSQLAKLLLQDAGEENAFSGDQITVTIAMEEDFLSTLTVQTESGAFSYTFTNWNETTVTLPKVSP